MTEICYMLSAVFVLLHSLCDMFCSSLAEAITRTVLRMEFCATWDPKDKLNRLGVAGVQFVGRYPFCKLGLLSRHS